MDPTLYRSLLAIDPKTNLPVSTNYILSTDGIGDISWQNVLYNISSMDESLGYLPSTIDTLNTYMYNISTGVLPGSLSTFNLTSTVTGLGTIGYISSPTLTSTIIGLGSLGYVSSLTFSSTIDGLGTTGYISSLSLNSTIRGLGTFGYVSTPSLTSSLIGLGTFGYVSTSYLTNIVNNLGSNGYISSLSLTSTINGLGSLYVSSQTLLSSIYGVNSNLISSTTDILNNKQNINLNNAGYIIIAGSNVNVTISSISSFYYYNSFTNSSIKYKGNNGAYTAYNNGFDLYISTLDTQLNRFSSFTTNLTNLSLEVYPNIMFPNIVTGLNPEIYQVSSFITYNASPINLQAQTQFLPMNVNGSNLFQQPLRINVPGSVINNNYSYPYLLTHRFVNVYGVNGFINSNVNLYFDSTSSYYLSIQNIAP